MRAAWMINMGFCLPQGHFAFHLNVCPIITSSGATATSTVSMSGRSLKRGRSQMSGHFAATPTDCVSGNMDQKSQWAKDTELDSHGKVHVSSCGHLACYTTVLQFVVL